MRPILASLPILEVLLPYFWGYNCSLKCEKHGWTAVRQEVRFVTNILRWNFQRELDTAVCFGIRCVTLPKNLKVEISLKLLNGESTKTNICHELYAFLLPDASL